MKPSRRGGLRPHHHLIIHSDDHSAPFTVLGVASVHSELHHGALLKADPLELRLLGAAVEVLAVAGETEPWGPVPRPGGKTQWPLEVGTGVNWRHPKDHEAFLLERYDPKADYGGPRLPHAQHCGEPSAVEAQEAAGRVV